jgi:biotin operon repressor
MAFNYRFSIIPAAAITDQALEPRDLQVLCLLGRHTDNDGWCSRSQVKMADELRCGRATIQRSLDRLCNAGYVQSRLRGRGSRLPDPDKQPFAAHSYRVLFDREALAAAQLAAEAKGGAHGRAPDVPSQDGHGVPTHERAPLEGTPCEVTPSEPVERDAHAKAEGKKVAGDQPADAGLKSFLAKWPTTACDDLGKTEQAWRTLTAADQAAALRGIEPFLQLLRHHKRSHPPSGWKYLEQKRWTQLPLAEDASTPGTRIVNCWSREWWALLLFKIERGQPGVGFMVIVRRGLEIDAETALRKVQFQSAFKGLHEGIRIDPVPVAELDRPSRDPKPFVKEIEFCKPLRRNWFWISAGSANPFESRRGHGPLPVLPKRHHAPLPTKILAASLVGRSPAWCHAGRPIGPIA